MYVTYMFNENMRCLVYPTGCLTPPSPTVVFYSVKGFEIVTTAVSDLDEILQAHQLYNANG